MARSRERLSTKLRSLAGWRMVGRGRPGPAAGHRPPRLRRLLRKSLHLLTWGWNTNVVDTQNAVQGRNAVNHNRPSSPERPLRAGEAHSPENLECG